MTDWERVEQLRADGVSWDKVASDRKAGFHPPPGADAGRALRTLYFQRRSRSSRSGPQTPGGSERRGDRAGRGGPKRLRSIIIGGSAVTVLILVIYLILTSGVLFGGPPKLGTNPGPGAAGTLAEFNYLSQQSTDACVWTGINLGDQTAYVNWINGLADNSYIQGSCCSPMDFTPDYSSQIPSLTSYASISLIPPDPYNVVAHTAKADVAHAGDALTSSQQSVFNTAASNTNDNGWCCCQCWAYYAHEGLAKALIVQYGYTAQQVDTVINLEDCCGGPGPMNMP
jgi:hypothetical protein